jgi:protein-S-isoprenylcysteine O-methyltransferase Ste14
MNHLNFITICWWVFFAVWIATAFSVKPTRERQDRGGRLFTASFLIIASLLLLGVIPLRQLNEPLWTFQPAILDLGYAFVCLGLLVALWARFSLGTNWSATVTLRTGHQLVERGPYRYIRHPIYTGMLLMFAGTALAIRTPAGLLAVLIIFLGHWWKFRREEALLLRHFPDTYPAYRARTKALIPFIF